MYRAWVFQKERSCVKFPFNHVDVRKGIKTQMLLCHTGMQVCRHVLILETKKPNNTKVSHGVSQGIETMKDLLGFYYLHFIIGAL